MDGPIDLGSDSTSGDSVSGDSDLGGDTQSTDFVDDLIVTPPSSRVDDGTDSDGPAIFKRNLLKDFEGASKGRTSVPLKKVKIEKD
jgi:hypothetical protein